MFEQSPIERAEALAPLVQAHADEAERERHLPAAVAAAFAKAGLYRIAMPGFCGGEEADPATQIRTIEAVSTADGSAGWNLMIGIESFGLIAPSFTQCADLIEDPMTVMCSSTAAVGRADKVEGGFRVSGQWQFVSGCHNSQLFGATVLLYENGERIPDTTRVYALVKKPEFEIVDTWYVGGLRGSGSHDIKLDDVFVPDAHIVAPIGGAMARNSALMRFPLGARLAYNKIGVSLGIARAAIDAFIELAEGKTPRFSSKTLRERTQAQQAVAKAEVRLRSARALVFDEVEKMWETVLSGQRVSAKERAIFQIACSDAAQACAEAVDWVCDAAGTSANQTGMLLERAARDIRVIRQHVTVASRHIEDGGRVLLGLDAQDLMLKM
ncbi:MAG: acyl-CoA dehydrogenase family protein [Pseudomonadota bacterium]